MDTVSSMIASGLRTRFESLDMLGNNLANAATRGFKADKEFFSLFTGEDQVMPEGSSTMPQIQKAWTDLSQGEIEPTGNPNDLAINGKGFFVVSGPDGPLYTRNGSLTVNSQGEVQTADGFAFRSEGGGAIRIMPDRPFVVDKNGVIRQNGVETGRLAVVDFTKPQSLTKFGRTYFSATTESGLQPKPLATEVKQGQVENSNVATSEGAVRIVGVMRQFEALQKAANLNAEMGKKVWDEVARVNG